MEQVKDKRTFFHVFPTLKVEDDIQILFADVEVQKITTNSSRDFLHVYIFSRHLIQKKQIWQMEQRIKDQLFGKTSVEVRIEEKYELSEQYTPEALMREYRESIIQELKTVSVLAANMFAQAEIHFEEGGVVNLGLADTIVSEGRKDEILTLLNKVFEERFQIKADIRISYREETETASMMSRGSSRRSTRSLSAVRCRGAKRLLHREKRRAGRRAPAGRGLLIPAEAKPEAAKRNLAKKSSGKRTSTVLSRREMTRI